MTNQEKFEYIALNYGVKTVDQISRKIGEPISRIHTYVMRMRRKGVPIKNVPAVPNKRVPRGPGIDYHKIIKMLE